MLLFGMLSVKIPTSPPPPLHRHQNESDPLQTSAQNSNTHCTCCAEASDTRDNRFMRHLLHSLTLQQQQQQQQQPVPCTPACAASSAAPGTPCCSTVLSCSVRTGSSCPPPAARLSVHSSCRSQGCCRRWAPPRHTVPPQPPAAAAQGLARSLYLGCMWLGLRIDRCQKLL
jgi:hypothetical protein